MTGIRLKSIIKTRVKVSVSSSGVDVGKILSGGESRGELEVPPLCCTRLKGYLSH